MLEQAPSRAAAQELALVDYVDRLDKRRAGRLAVHIHLSQLSRRHARVHYLNMANDMFAHATHVIDGHLFILRNHDLVFIANTSPFAELDRAVNRLRALFNEDPLFTHKNSAASSFCTWYRLDSDYDALRLASRRWLVEAQQAQADYIRPDPSEGLVPLAPELLGRIERTLNTTDTTNMARRQMVCTILPGQPLQPLFEEIYISIFDLQALVTPGVNWLANPWLFQYLTHTLDKRMMAMLMKGGVTAEHSFSINLNVASVLSPEFRRFEETMTPYMRSRPVIEFSKLDVFADMGAFLFARDYLRERGFRTCLDGLTHLTLPHCNRAQLGFDLIKLFWVPDGIEEMLPETRPALQDMVREAGQARTILCRCENAQALEVGQQLGILMFQGRHIDKLYAAAGRPAVSLKGN